MKKRQVLKLLSIAIPLLMACAGSRVPSDLSPEQRMEVALKMFNKGDYFDAKTQFRIITLSHSGSTIADEAQFYLGECHFKMKEYILSASEYERLTRVYPNSEYVDDAKYKLGLSYYELSPKFSMDQDYTQKAIREFQEFLEDYPNSDLTNEVMKKLDDSRNKLAHKIFSSAEQYRKMGIYKSAAIYYTMVLEKYYDSKYAARSLYWSAESYRKMREYQKALEAFQAFVEKYPQNELISSAKSKIVEIRERLKNFSPEVDQLSKSS